MGRRFPYFALDPGVDEQYMFYPVRAQIGPASLWLRREMLAIGRELDRASPKR